MSTFRLDLSGDGSPAALEDISGIVVSDGLVVQLASGGPVFIHQGAVEPDPASAPAIKILPSGPGSDGVFTTQRPRTGQKTWVWARTANTTLTVVD